MSFSLVLNSSNVQNTSTNTTFKYNFIQGGFQVKDMEMCVSIAEFPLFFLKQIDLNRQEKLFRMINSLKLIYMKDLP